MPKENCYFFVDNSVAYEDRTIKVLCTKCQEKKMIDRWFWEGSLLGYGPFDFICCYCSHVIHKGEKNENKND